MQLTVIGYCVWVISSEIKIKQGHWKFVWNNSQVWREWKFKYQSRSDKWAFRPCQMQKLVIHRKKVISEKKKEHRRKQRILFASRLHRTLLNLSFFFFFNLRTLNTNIFKKPKIPFGRNIQVKKHCSGPGWCDSGDWAPACKPKGCWFNSQSGHMPGLQARSPIGGTCEATTLWCFSPSLSPSLPLPLKINK